MPSHARAADRSTGRRAAIADERQRTCVPDTVAFAVEMSARGGPRVLCFATQGHEHIEGERIRVLLEPLGAEEYRFDRAHKLRSAVGLLKTARARRPEVIVMEGTGLGGGVPLLALRALLGVRFVVSSGDAVAPFLRLHSRAAGLLGAVYERMLCRYCAGFVGWTPYLVGRALTFGAPRGMTVPGWTRSNPTPGAREQIRGALGISDQAIVIGLVGSLHWNGTVEYVYGAEIVKAVRRAARDDVVACIVGDGDGRARLEELAGDDLGKRVLLPGRVPAEQVPDYLAAFDAGSLSQSVDQVGAFRYTTKLSEYLAVGLPVITGEVPAAYDLDEGYFWRLPGRAPWSSTYIDALTELLRGLGHAEIEGRRDAAIAASAAVFDRTLQQRRMRAFVQDILAAPAQAD
jgi:glycosyltransferase involved in cell wall biosynthesis